MRMFVMLLAVLSVAVAACVALPYVERDEETELSQAILERVQRSPLPEERKSSSSGDGTRARSQTGASRATNVRGNATQAGGGPQSETRERQGGVAWDIKW